MKPIKINENTKNILLEQFKAYLDQAKLSTDTVNFNTKLQNTLIDTPKAEITLSATAYLKIMLYVRDTATEIAWHGTVERNDNKYFIKDVFLYPQTLAAATVTTDQAKYNDWIEKLPDDIYNNMRLQGHSHVNFGVSPSGTDSAFYDSILQVLPNNDYYIFMIINKAGDMNFLIYDLASNLIYEKEDIIIHIAAENEDICNLITMEKELYCTKPEPIRPTYGYSAITGQPIDFTGNPVHSTKFGTWDDPYTETDALFDDIDARFKNSKLRAKTKRKKS